MRTVFARKCAPFNLNLTQIWATEKLNLPEEVFPRSSHIIVYLTATLS